MSVQGRVLDTVGSVSSAILGRFADVKNSLFEKTVAPIQEWIRLCEPKFLEGLLPAATKYKEGGYLVEAF